MVSSVWRMTEGHEQPVDRSAVTRRRAVVVGLALIVLGGIGIVRLAVTDEDAGAEPTLPSVSSPQVRAGGDSEPTATDSMPPSSSTTTVLTAPIRRAAGSTVSIAASAASLCGTVTLQPRKPNCGSAASALATPGGGTAIGT